MWGLWHCLGGYVSRGDMQSQELSGGENLSKILWDPPWLHGEARGDQKITIGGRLGGVKDNYYLVERPESKSSEGDMQQFHEFSKGRNCGDKRYLKRDAAQKVIIQWSSPPCIASDFAIG